MSAGCVAKHGLDPILNALRERERKRGKER